MISSGMLRFQNSMKKCSVTTQLLPVGLFTDATGVTTVSNVCDKDERALSC